MKVQDYFTVKGLFENYVISKLTYMVLQIMSQHDAIYLVGSLIMMNDGPSLLSLILAQKCVSKSLHPEAFQSEIIKK